MTTEQAAQVVPVPVVRETVRETDEVKRTSGPQTTNGKRWEVQLNGTPTIQWLQLFKLSKESSLRALPHRVEFDRTSAAFKCDDTQVEHWIAAIDTWMAATTRATWRLSNRYGASATTASPRRRRTRSGSSS